jgi:integrase
MSLKVKDVAADFTTMLVDGKTGPRQCHLHPKASTLLCEICEGKAPDALVLDANGKGWTRTSVSRAFRRACEAAGLGPEVVFYSLRHYHISRALLAGVPVQIVADNVGTSAVMLDRAYAKFTRSARLKLIAKIDL